MQIENRDVQVLITDGLSADAVHHNVHDLLPVLEDKESQQLAAEFSGIDDIEFENSVIPNIYYGGIPPMEGASLVAERCMQILDNKAAGNRLNAILGSRMGLSDMVQESKVKAQKTAETIRIHDFLGQKSITKADVIMLIHWGVKEILLSTRTIVAPFVAPLAMDLLQRGGIKLRYNQWH